MEILSRSPKIYKYQNEKTIQYAHTWALKRNPAYPDFEKFGGDCTNFASQSIFAGSEIMNYNKYSGWYYSNINNRSPSWTGVNYLYNFLINNKGPGPFAEIVDIKDIKPGDLSQMSFQTGPVFNHSLVIVQTGNPPSVDNILVSTHTDDQNNYSLTEYEWVSIRYIHIIGVRGE